MHRPRIQIAMITCLLLLLTGCGEQSKQYATSKAAETFFTVPNDWREISFEKLTEYEKNRPPSGKSANTKSVIWQIAYTPLKKLKLSEVYSVQSYDQPVVVARVRDLSYEEGNQISYNLLRDTVVPLQNWIQNPDQAPANFSVVSDYEIYDQGVRGIRTVFTFDNKGKNLTFDQVAMVSNDRHRLYLLFSRCLTTCYQKNEQVIDGIVTSFTVRGKK